MRRVTRFERVAEFYTFTGNLNTSFLEITLNSKLPYLPPSIFAMMNQLARKYDAINLAQGFPDFPADKVLLDYASEAMKLGYNQYAPMSGIYSLREAISRKIKSLYGATYDPDSSITLTTGATQAIFTAITAFVHQGDEVILFKPAYDCYEPSVVANGGIPVPIQMQGKAFTIDWDHFRGKLSPKTRMVIINSPHNPSGTVFSEHDMLQLQDSLRGTGILVLSDEAYEHLIFDGLAHQSVARYPELASRSLLCASFGKTFHITGWKMGYCAASPELMAEFRKIHEFNVYAVNHPMQHALARYLENADNYLGLPAFFQGKRDFFLSAVKDSRFKYTPSQGTYFQLLDYSEISDEGDVAFAERLARDFGLAAIPISVFSMDGEDHRQIRFCFAKKEDTLEKAGEILRRI